jgi:uncharacterized protein YkwD
LRAKLPLALALLALCLAAAVGATARHTSALTTCAADGALDSEEQAFLQLINDYRQQNGLAPLSPSDTLDGAAQWKSQNMADNSYFAHDDTPINRTWVQRIRDCGYGYNTYLGENIAAGISSAADAFSLWKNSPGHNANMLGANYSAIGIGRAYVAGSPYGWYWTTDFGGVADGYTSGSTPTPASTRTPAPTATRTPALPPASYPCLDFDRDGIVYVGDIVYVVSRFSTSDTSADIDRSGTVTVVDILIVVSEYGTHCTA